MKIIYGQHRDQWMGRRDRRVRGLSNIGRVLIRQGRLTFPNTQQHLVSDSLTPPRPGHHKILALLLVDPNSHIFSTAHIPCQQRGVVGREPLVKDQGVENYVNKLPNEWNLGYDYGYGGGISDENWKKQRCWGRSSWMRGLYLHQIELFVPYSNLVQVQFMLLANSMAGGLASILSLFIIT